MGPHQSSTPTTFPCPGGRHRKTGLLPMVTSHPPGVQVDTLRDAGGARIETQISPPSASSQDEPGLSNFSRVSIWSCLRRRILVAAHVPAPRQGLIAITDDLRNMRQKPLRKSGRITGSRSSRQAGKQGEAWMCSGRSFARRTGGTSR